MATREVVVLVRVEGHQGEHLEEYVHQVIMDAVGLKLRVVQDQVTMGSSELEGLVHLKTAVVVQVLVVIIIY